MRNGKDGALTPAPELHSFKTRLKKGFFIRGSSPCGLGQGCSQPPVALSCSSASSLAGAFIVAWTDRRPRC